MGLIYDLGRLAGRKVTQAKWMLSALAGSEDERIDAELAYGRVMAESYANETPVDDSPEIGGVVRETGGALAARLTNKRRVFNFYCDARGAPNAFALPGGFIFASRPLVELCADDRDQLAFVLAHEIAHVVKGHSSDRFLTSVVLNLVARHGVAGGAVKSALATLLGTLVQKGYSRDQELDADEFALRLVKSAGLDAAGGTRLFANLKERLGQREGLGEYFATHPSFDVRIAQLEKLA